jgi:zinc/manganese transport system substrate-binding protein
MTKLENSSPSKSRIVVTTADVLRVHGAETNPHLWYDVPRLDRIAGAIAGALARSDPGQARAYHAGLRRFERSLVPLRREVATIRRRFRGAPVAYTEPDLIAKHRIRVLLYNSQAVSPITSHIRDAARAAGIPVVPVTETLPAGLGFQQWQLDQARRLAAALGKR